METRSPRRVRLAGRPGPGGRLDLRLATRSLTAGLLSVLMTGVLAADVIVLNNGNEIQGEVIQEDEKGVVVRFAGGTLRLKRNQIQKILRQSRLVYLLEEGEKALRQKDYRRAIETLEKARQEAPDSTRARLKWRDARHSYAAHLQEQNRHQNALNVYRALLDDDPDDAKAREEIEFIREAQHDAISEVEQARQELWGGDAETSLWRLQRIHETYPDLRESVSRDLARACVRLGHDHGGRAEWAEAAKLFHRAVVVDPEQIAVVRIPYITCMLNQIVPLAQAGKFEGIEPLARRGLEVDPSNEQLNYFLALSLDARGKLAEAARLYAFLLGKRASSTSQQAVSLLREEAERLVLKDRRVSEAFYETRAAKVLPGKFREISSPHFVVKHRNRAIGMAVSRTAERFYTDLFRRLGCRTHWRNPCEIVIYPTREEYVDTTRTGAWSGAAHQLTSIRGIFSKHRIASYQAQSGLTSGLLQHEIAHALLIHQLNYTPGVPLWASEGFAVSEEPVYVKRYFRQLAARQKGLNGLIPVSELLRSVTYPDSRKVRLFYAQSFTLVDHLLRRKGLKTFVAFLRDLSTKSLLLEGALRRHYGLRGVVALENSYLGSLR